MQNAGNYNQYGKPKYQSKGEARQQTVGKFELGTHNRKMSPIVHSKWPDSSQNLVSRKPIYGHGETQKEKAKKKKNKLLSSTE